jgi:heat shock protein HslJ
MASQLLVALSVFMLAACARGQSALDGTRWRLTEWTLSSLDPRDFDITAEFADVRVSGHGGVNSYGGLYTVGSRRSFKVGQLAGTQIAGPELAMRAEGAYLTLLGQACSYRVETGRLTLFDAGGNESLIFEATKANPPAARRAPPAALPRISGMFSSPSPSWSDDLICRARRDCSNVLCVACATVWPWPISTSASRSVARLAGAGHGSAAQDHRS